METMILGTLGYLGNKYNSNNNKKIKIKPNKCKLSHEKYGQKIYSNKMSKKIKRTTENQAKQLKENGFASQFDTMMLDNIGPPVSVNQSNTIKREGFHGYDISLQRDIDFNNEYSEFGKTQMHYDAVPQIEMMTSNMQPHSSKRDLTNYNQDYSHQLSLHTGVDPFYMSKDTFDPVTIFEPIKDLTYVHGAPVMTDVLEERYLASNKNNFGNLPFANNLKVQPGIEGEEQGSGNPVYRILPKRTDELRSKNNQKKSYKADKIEAVQKGQYRPTPDNLTKYKMPTYRERDIDDYLPNTAVVSKKKQTGKFQNINTNRSKSTSVVGHLHDPTKGNRKTSKTNESCKVTYANDSIARAVSNVTSKPVLQNKGSYRNVENERNSTNHNIPGTAYATNEGTYAIDTNDIPLTTLRQLMIDGDTNIGITSNKNNNTYVFSKDTVIPETHRSINTHNTKEGIMNPVHKQSYTIDRKDKPKTTIRQTTTHMNVIGSLNTEHKKGYQLDKNDTARNTIRQTTEHMNIIGTANPEHKEGHYFNDNDTARNTIRQTTEHMNIIGTANPEHKEGHYFNDNDTARNTIRQTTEYMTVAGSINPTQKETQYYNKNDLAKNTIRQTTEHMGVESNIQPINSGPNYVNYSDKPNITIRNTTSSADYISNTNRSQGNNPYMFNIKNKARPTIKHTTLYTAPETNIANTSQGNVIYNKDKARVTIRQSTLHSTQGGRTGNETGTVGYTRDLYDKTRQTIRQTTLHSTQGGRLGSCEGGQVYTKDKKDKARPTIKSSTLHSTQGGRLRRQDGGEQYVRDEEDEARQTIRQTTLHSTQGGRIGSYQGGEVYTIDKNDKAKQTIRQTTLHSTQAGRIGRQEGGQQYTRDEKDKARVTIKQTTLLQNHTGPLKSSVDKDRSQQAEQNMCIDERREILTYNRPAGPKSDRVGPILTKNNVKLKEENFLKRDNYGYDKSSCNLGHLNKLYTRNKELLNAPSYRINKDFINTLDNNPLVNDLMHQKHNN